jgi:hypothetical protein
MCKSDLDHPNDVFFFFWVVKFHILAIFFQNFFLFKNEKIMIFRDFNQFSKF